MPPTLNSTLSTAACPTEIAMLSYCAVRKPESSTVTAYVPGASASARYRPSASLVNTRCWPVSVSLTVTVAPGSAAFDESRTTPEIDPVVPCAAATARPPHSTAVAAAISLTAAATRDVCISFSSMLHPGASPPDPLHAHSRGPLSPRSVRVTRFARSLFFLQGLHHRNTLHSRSNQDPRTLEPNPDASASDFALRSGH